MRQIDPYTLWIGHARDGRDFRRVVEAGIGAVVHLAYEEEPASPPRDLIYARIPLLDGGDNPPGRLRLAVETVAGLLRGDIRTLVTCGFGMSRSPAIVAAAIGRITGQSAESGLSVVLRSRIGDVSPALWGDILKMEASRESLSMEPTIAGNGLRIFEDER